MGGDFESTVQSGKPGAGGKSAEGQVTSSPLLTPVMSQGHAVGAATGVPAGQVLRRHKSGNEFHFHDDANKLKCAVPAADFYTIARNMRSMRPSYYYDMKNQTLLRVEPFVSEGVADLSISVEKVTIGAALANIEEFCTQAGI